jgi:hypothetical protein
VTEYQRLRYHLGPYVARVGRARGARGPLTLRLAGTPERWIERNNEQRKSYLSTGGFQLTDQISGWDPEREQTAQNGKCKLLDVR